MEGSKNTRNNTKEIVENRLTDSEITDKKQITAAFNEYSLNIGRELAEKITQKPIKKYFSFSNLNSMVYLETDEEEVECITSQLKNIKSIVSGIFPEILKVSVVVPIYKGPQYLRKSLKSGCVVVWNDTDYCRKSNMDFKEQGQHRML
ncbi:hypothetical protein WA026_022981 [Henosepilachna vigintioctopunctata]|uniref:Uncharacterized protein n=1 Tax=Henosepilachna vigintioctopunctata TaxID=420089 RepID=A0AAW1TXY2_9CUCU